MRNKPSTRLRQSFAWGILLFVFLAGSYLVYFILAVCKPPAAADQSLNPSTGTIVALTSSFLFAIVCLLIVTFRPENRIGWLCGVCALSNLLVITFGYTGTCALASGEAFPWQEQIFWFGNFTGFFLLLLPTYILLPLWFPNGQFLSPRWKKFWIAALAVGLLSAVLNAILPGGLLESGDITRESPFALNFAAPDWLSVIRPVFTFVPLMLLAIIANSSLIFRYRRSDASTRQQIKAFTFIALSGIILLLVVELLKLIPGFQEILLGLAVSWFYFLVLLVGWNGYPVAIGVSVLRYRLYQIDLIIRRTLVYGILTVTLALVFLISVALFQALFTAVSGQSSAVATVISTLLIAAIFNPLRRKIQQGIDRRFYRSKYDSEKALHHFAQTVRTETDLDALSLELVKVVKETMQPDQVSIWLAPPRGSKYNRDN